MPAEAAQVGATPGVPSFGRRANRRLGNQTRSGAWQPRLAAGRTLAGAAKNRPPPADLTRAPLVSVQRFNSNDALVSCLRDSPQNSTASNWATPTSSAANAPRLGQEKVLTLLCSVLETGQWPQAIRRSRPSPEVPEVSCIADTSTAAAQDADRGSPPLVLGSLRVWPPVVLAPMAGVTNYPFRFICRRFGAGLAVSEMVMARPLVEGRGKTLKIAGFGSDERPRSLQLYGVDPWYIGEAVRWLVGEGQIDHLDMNLGCPVRKITARGGGAALALRPQLLREILRAAVRAAGDIPVTAKFRLGIDDEHLTYMTTGRIAQEEGCAAVGLHARTAAQLYGGRARWEAIGELRQGVRIPVLGNGDIWEGRDGPQMVRSTGCHGVIVGRGALGRPWLFRDLADAFAGRTPAPGPCFGEVASIMLEHAQRLAAWIGEPAAMRAFRRHVTWYTKCFRHSARLRERLSKLERLSELRGALQDCDPSEPFPATAAQVPRGKSGRTQRVSLPPGLLEQSEAQPVGAEDPRGPTDTD
ncbi:MAG: tRNA dihydrouridine synthase DusB [Polyangiaceae bacterium]|nr:tRNA dihydrouridine synthase DusB [Polyangiaceae bacterium]